MKFLESYTYLLDLFSRKKRKIKIVIDRSETNHSNLKAAQAG